MTGKILDRYLDNSFIDDDGQRYMNHDVGMYCECPECLGPDEETETHVLHLLEYHVGGSNPPHEYMRDCARQIVRMFTEGAQ